MIKYINLGFLAILLAIVLIACGSDSEQKKETNESAVTYNVSSEEILKTIEGCDEATKECTHIKINNTVLKGGDESVTSVANKIISEESVALVSESVSEDGNMNLDQVTSLLFNDWKEYQSNGGSEFAWYVDVTSEAVQIDKLVNIRMTGTSYTGGAHNNTYTKFFLIDLREGNKMELENYISSGSTFKALAEERFREHFDLTPDADLGAEGFFFEDGKFTLPAEMGISETGVVLYYNHYEILPYSEGPTLIEIPYERLQGVVNFEM